MHKTVESSFTLCYAQVKANTRLRLTCSDLREDLSNVNLVESPLYSCGLNVEDAEHYIKDCLNYVDCRN